MSVRAANIYGPRARFDPARLQLHPGADSQGRRPSRSARSVGLARRHPGRHLQRRLRRGDRAAARDAARRPAGSSTSDRGRGVRVGEVVRRPAACRGPRARAGGLHRRRPHLVAQPRAQHRPSGSTRCSGSHRRHSRTVFARRCTGGGRTGRHGDGKGRRARGDHAHGAQRGRGVRRTGGQPEDTAGFRPAKSSATSGCYMPSKHLARLLFFRDIYPLVAATPTASSPSSASAGARRSRCCRTCAASTSRSTATAASSDSTPSRGFGASRARTARSRRAATATSRSRPSYEDELDRRARAARAD